MEMGMPWKFVRRMSRPGATGKLERVVDLPESREGREPFCWRYTEIVSEERAVRGRIE
jgi:hypothetical protein